MRISFVLASIAVASASLPASAASLLTTPTGYTGPVLNLSGFQVPLISYDFTIDPPIALPGGITLNSVGESNTVSIGIGNYNLNENGQNTVNGEPFIGTNDPFDIVILTFDAPVASFGARLNYALDNGQPVVTDPIISAFDSMGVLIASFNLFDLAPISTPNAMDTYRFRGIDGGGAMIKSFTIQGSFMVMAGAVPEPATWAMMIAGFGMVGATMRRRRTVAA